MTYQFEASFNPSITDCAQVAALSPDNPFHTPGFVAARSAMGASPWVLSLREGGAPVAACTAFILTGRLTRVLEIPSVPVLPEPDAFWRGLRQFCRDEKVTELLVESFASEAAVIPPLATEIWRRPRCEYVLDLTNPTLLRSMSSNHKRNIRRAENANVQARILSSFEGACDHVRLVAASRDRNPERRRKTEGDPLPEHFMVFLRSGAGVLYQAFRGKDVVSSALILKAERGGYYHSAGVTQDGITIGAAHFLVSHIATNLGENGITRFNLGGADPDQIGLNRFKSGFGATPVQLEAARFLFGGRFRWVLLRVLRNLRSRIRSG